VAKTFFKSYYPVQKKKKKGRTEKKEDCGSMRTPNGVPYSGKVEHRGERFP